MSPTVLIADDAEFMRAMLKDILTEMGLSVLAEAADGQQAVSLYAEAMPDLAILDITMPKVDGIEALKAIRASDPQALVVMISALGQKEKVLEAIQAGARDFIIKPFDQERVRATIGQLLARTQSSSG